MAKVLVVEDDESIARLMEVELELAGHSVAIAGNGSQGLEVLAEVKPDIVLLDWMMPDLTGIDVLRELRKRGLRKGLRVVMVTAKVQESDMLKGWQEGVDEYLSKPFDMDVLSSTVDRVLAASPEELERRREEELSKAGLLRKLDQMLE